MVLSNKIDDFIKRIAPNGESVRIQMGASGRVVYGQMASGQRRCELDEERLETLVDALNQSVPSVIEQDYSKKRPVIAIIVDGNTVFRQERDGVVSVNNVQQILQKDDVGLVESEPVFIEQVPAQQSHASKVPGALVVAARLSQTLPISNTRSLLTDWVNQTTEAVVEKAWKLQSSLEEARLKSEKVLGTVSSRVEMIKLNLREQQVAAVASKLFNYHHQQVLAKNSGKDTQDYTRYQGQNYTLLCRGRNTYEIYENSKSAKPLMRFKETAWGSKILNNNFTEKNYRDFQETQKKLQRFGLEELAPGIGKKHLGRLAPASSVRESKRYKQSSLALE